MHKRTSSKATISHQVFQWILIKEAVEAGIGVSIVSKWAVLREAADGRLKLLTFREGNIQRDLSLFIPSRKHLTHVMEEFLMFLRKYPYETFFNKI